MEDRQLVDMFNRYGIRGLSCKIRGLRARKQEFPVSGISGAVPGHEGVLPYLHPSDNSPDAPWSRVVEQILEDRRSLEAAVGYPVRGLSIPTVLSDEIEGPASPGNSLPRTVEETGALPCRRIFCGGRLPAITTTICLELERNLCLLHKTQYLYMMYVWGHSHEFNIYGNWDVMEGVLQELRRQG